MRFYTDEELGPNRALTPEGFLVCYDVPIGRVGTMVYGPGETPIEVGSDGIAHVERSAEDLFRPETIASFNGKPVTNGHPDENVTPKNWRILTMGIVTNPRRGTGDEKDIMVADLFITDADSIEELSYPRKDKRWEVSSGYDADYEELGTGRGRQTNIIGNHVALVPSGRCGPRCAIKDHRTIDCGSSKACSCGGKDMTWKDKILAAFYGKDEAALKKALDTTPVRDEETAGGVHIHTEGRTKFTDEALDAKFGELDQKHATHDADIAELKKKLEGNGEEEGTGDRSKGARDRRTRDDEAEEERKRKEREAAEDADEVDCPECGGTGKVDGEPCPDCDGTGKVPAEEAEPANDEKKQFVKDMAYEIPGAVKAKNSNLVAQEFRDTVAAAEVISPGIRIPTFDRKRLPETSFRDIFNLRRRALDAAIRDKDMAAIIKEVRGNRPLTSDGLKQMTNRQVRDLFYSVAAVRKNKNNDEMSRGSIDTENAIGTTLTPADVNKRNSEYWSKRGVN